jgi:hypothetical protein
MRDATKTTEVGGSVASALGGAAALTGLVLALHALALRGWRFPILATAARGAPSRVSVILVGTAIACAVTPRAWRRWLLLAGAAIAYPLVLGAWVVPLVGYVAVVCALTRTRLSVLTQVVLAVVVWCVPPIAHAVVAPAAAGQALVLAVLWAGVIYAALFVIVERGRHPGEASLLDDALYCFALPRLAEPFFQPIGGRYLRQRDSVRPSWRLVARGIALGAYGVVLVAIVHALAGRAAGRSEAEQVARDFLRFYATVTSQIFIAVAVFRLLGFDLASGFRAPFISRSFSEFFRRYNHYVRDAVMSLFYYPFLGTLRRRLPRRAAVIVSSLGAIFVGSYLLNDFLVPVVTAADPRTGLRSATNPIHLAVLAVYWCLIVIPPLVALPRRADGRPWLPRLAKIAIFNVVFLFIWLHSGWHHQVR